MAGLVLDAGPLLTISSSSEELRGWLQVARERAAPPIVSAAVVAEVWRGGRRSARLGQLFRIIHTVPVDETLARRAGQLLAETGSASTVDALVVVLAAQRGFAVLTSDPSDVGPLAAHLGVEMQTL